MADLTALLAEVQKEKTIDASVEALLKNISDRLKALELSQPSDQAQIDAITADIDGNLTELSAAVVANTPPAAPAQGAVGTPGNPAPAVAAGQMDATGSMTPTAQVPAHQQTASTFTPVYPPISQTTTDTPISEGGPNDPAAAHIAGTDANTANADNHAGITNGQNGAGQSTFIPAQNS